MVQYTAVVVVVIIGCRIRSRERGCPMVHGLAELLVVVGGTGPAGRNPPREGRRKGDDGGKG